jgi:hypothetical protein
LLNWQTITWVIRHDPMPVVGFLLVGAAAVLSFHLQRKPQAAGERNLNQLIAIPNTTLWTLPRAYLEARSRHGWSAWPAYAVWGCIASGLALLVAGLARFGALKREPHSLVSGIRRSHRFCAFHSPFSGVLSVIEIFRQLTFIRSSAIAARLCIWAD